MTRAMPVPLDVIPVAAAEAINSARAAKRKAAIYLDAHTYARKKESQQTTRIGIILTLVRRQETLTAGK